MFRESLGQLLGDCSPEEIVFVTGAGLSAASGIPTFRGEGGYWTVGSTEYRPEQLATWEAFQQMPREVWRWYLYRRGVCRDAAPNLGHEILATLEQELGPRFHLITQNVDGLHLRAGNSIERTFEIHGNIDFMRCLDESCSARLQPMDAALRTDGRDAPLDDETWGQLRCHGCGGPTRPHVLWFDEYYDEVHYRATSSLDVAKSASLVVTIGTSGATNLPHQVVATAIQNGAAFVDINPQPNPFSEIAEQLPRGLWMSGPSNETLPIIADALAASMRDNG